MAFAMTSCRVAALAGRHADSRTEPPQADSHGPRQTTGVAPACTVLHNATAQYVCSGLGGGACTYEAMKEIGVWICIDILRIILFPWLP